ncbi:MAG: YgiQ family radical SAM protein [Desulfobacterota bacterium]|nr:YgiQ family radical SAM protein [Thermodesulfobacteriota bacterium]
MTRSEMRRRGWDELDVVLVSGDAYVDHPAFGAAVIGRVLEQAGYRVGIIAQPDWHSTRDFTRLGRPRLFFGITAGNVDSMVANYTANKRPRNDDAYAPGGKAGLRPDRASLVYANRIREAFGRVVIVLGGIEASMRRFAHYDYWDNRVRRSLLVDARADILVYGMGEVQICALAQRLQQGVPLDAFPGIPGTAIVTSDIASVRQCVLLPSYEEVAADQRSFNEAFRLVSLHQHPRSQPLAQQHANRWVICFPPQPPLQPRMLDRIYRLPFTRRWHPAYDRDGVPACEPVRFSIVAHRGCCGQCSFCSLSLHQGRIVQSRSTGSIIAEARRIAAMPDFKGTITDVGGPTANLYGATCPRWKHGDFCDHRACLYPSVCPQLKLGYQESIKLYRTLRKIEGVRHVFIGSGFRHDLLCGDEALPYLTEICTYHISGRMKIAPEHIDDNVLRLMGKPGHNIYEAFVDRFFQVIKELGREQYLVQYFMCSHPGATLTSALRLGRYLMERRIYPEQVQDFIPLPMTRSAAQYYTGTDPLTGKSVSVPKTFRERKMQRALAQYWNPGNRQLIIQALRLLRVEHLIRSFMDATAQAGGRGHNETESLWQEE